MVIAACVDEVSVLVCNVVSLGIWFPKFIV